MKKFVYLLIFMFMGLGTFGENKNPKETLIIAQEGEIKTLDPHFGNDGFSLRIYRMIYSRLVEQDKDLNVIPGLAKSWKRIDDKTIEFTLREDIKFSDGSSLTGEDVKYSFDRMKNSPRIKSFLPPIETIETFGKNKIRIKTSYTYGPLLQQLTHPALSIISSKSTEDNIIGTGPYKFQKWNRGEEIILEKNKYYFEKYNSPKIVIFKTIPEQENRAIMLETKEADIAIGISPVDEKIISENKNLKLLKRDSISYSYLGLNMKKDIFKNKDMRLAINYAIDRDLLIEAGLNGQGIEAKSPIGKEVFGYKPVEKLYAFNLEKAKELRAKISEKKINLTLAIMAGGNEMEIAEIIQGFLKEINIDVEIIILEPGAYWAKTSQGEYDMYLGAWAAATGDGDYGLYPTHYSKNFGAPGNRTFYMNEEVDSLLEKGRKTIDENERKEIYGRIQDIIVDDSVEVMLYYKILSVGTQKNIKGLNLYPIPIHDFSHITKE